LSREVDEVAASTRARGMAAIGGGERGGWLGESWTVGVDGVVVLGEDGEVLEVGRGDPPTSFAEAPSLDFRTWANLNLRCLSIFESAPKR